jgi:hypothetical protein
LHYNISSLSSNGGISLHCSMFFQALYPVGVSGLLPRELMFVLCPSVGASVYCFLCDVLSSVTMGRMSNEPQLFDSRCCYCTESSTYLSTLPSCLSESRLFQEDFRTAFMTTICLIHYLCDPPTCASHSRCGACYISHVGCLLSRIVEARSRRILLCVEGE